MTNWNLNIDGCEISTNSKAYIIAEIGHNHQGSMELCKELIDAAINCGVSACKLQTRNNKTLFTKQVYNSAYTSSNSYGSTYGEHREALEFSYEQLEHLVTYARNKKMTLFSTAFDEASADLLFEIGMPAFKIASGDLTNTPLLKHLAKLGRPMLVSTGGGTMIDVRRAYDTIMPHNQSLCILQCTAAYPVKAKEVNLNVISTFSNVFNDIAIGLSDHTENNITALAAYALGARVIEKHFTLDRAMKGSDHNFSLTPAMMKNMVDNLNFLADAMGDGLKCSYESEQKALSKMRKTLVAASDLPVGHVLESHDLIAKTSPSGLPPYRKELLLGHSLKKALSLDEYITEEHIGTTLDI